MKLLGVLLGVLLPTVTLAATLDVPSPGDRLSGLGVIHGWKCNPQQITVSIDGSDPIPALAPYPRADTGGACGNAGWNGFFTIVNWGIFGDGAHTITASDNGVPFATHTFTVTTLGEEFVTGVEKRATIADFPAPGQSVELEWNQSTQHFELVPGPASAGVYGYCFASFQCPAESDNSNSAVSTSWCSQEANCVESVVQRFCGEIPASSAPVSWSYVQWISLAEWSPEHAEENAELCRDACTAEDHRGRAYYCYPDYAAETGLPPWAPSE